jgi:cell division protein FtsA
MQEDKIIVGLDIGTTKICAIVGRKNEYGKLEILGMGKAVSDGVIRGIVTNDDFVLLHCIMIYLQTI